MHPRIHSFFALGVALVLAGCALLPEMRVFQKTVDPRMAETPPATLEGQKQAAEYIEMRSAPPPTDGPVTPVPTAPQTAREAEMKAALADIHTVAASLSASLGEPKEAVTLEDKAAVIAALRDGLLAKDAQLEAWKEFARKYAGKPIEDTGINLAGPAGFIGLVGIVAACIFVPGFGWLLLRLLPVLWAALKRAAGAVEAIARRAPEAVAEMKAALPQKEDGARKLVRAAKRRLKNPLAA